MSEKSLGNGPKMLVPILFLVLSCAGPLGGAFLFYKYEAFFTSETIPSVVFCLAGAVAVGAALLPSFVLAAGAGWLFDTTEGLIVTVAALALGTMLGIGIGRCFRVNTKSLPVRWGALAEKLLLLVSQRPRWYVNLSLILLRLAPHAPFALTNFIAAQLPLGFWRVFVLSVVGLLPRTLTAFFIGTGLAQLSDASREGSGSLVQTFVFIGLIALVGFGAKRWAQRSTGQELT